MAGLSSQAGGSSAAGAVPYRVGEPDTTSMTIGRGRVPATPSATVASAIRWLAFSTRPGAPAASTARRGRPSPQQLVVRGMARWSAPAAGPLNSSRHRERSSSASASVHRGHVALFPAVRRPQPAGQDQDQRPGDPGQEPGGRVPDRSQRPDRPGAQRGVHQQLQPGYRADVADALSAPDTPATRPGRPPRASRARSSTRWPALRRRRTPRAPDPLHPARYSSPASVIVRSSPPIAGSTPKCPSPPRSTRRRHADRTTTGPSPAGARRPPRPATSASHPGPTAARAAVAPSSCSRRGASAFKQRRRRFAS